jgi:hypothetical protein
MTDNQLEIQYDRRSSFIIELSVRDLQFISQAMHIYQFSSEFNLPRIAQTLDQLVQQTTVVHKEAQRHNVYINAFDSTPTAISTKPVFFIPVMS